MAKFRFSALALTLVAVSPAASLAGEDPGGLEGLDVTMVVLDNTLELKYAVSEMDGSDGDDVSDHDWNDIENPVEQFQGESESKIVGHSEDEMKEIFEGDDFFKDEDKMNEEYDFDDRDDIDVDELSEESDEFVD